MNLIAIDIGNTSITIALYLKDKEDHITSMPGSSAAKLSDCIKSYWGKIPVLTSSTEKKRNGVIVVSSVKPQWTETIRQIAKDNLGEKIYVIGKDIPFSMDLSVKEPDKVGTDRVLAASAAYAVVEDAVVIADFGTAITIDLVDEKGIFLGGAICPGFEISAKALHASTVHLPKVKVSRPKSPYGRTTTEAISCGLYYSAIATLQEVIRRYAEKLGKWPQTVITGSAAELIKDDCDFIDSYVPNLVVKGISLAYRKYIDAKIE